MAKDMGKPGKTPKSKQWFEAKSNLHGWEKDMPMAERRKKAAIGASDLKSARKLQALANVTTDRETKKAARADAKYFFMKHKVI